METSKQDIGTHVLAASGDTEITIAFFEKRVIEEEPRSPLHGQKVDAFEVYRKAGYEGSEIIAAGIRPYQDEHGYYHHGSEEAVKQALQQQGAKDYSFVPKALP